MSCFAALAALLLAGQQDPTRALIEKLGSDSIEEREEAARRLSDMGPAAIPHLQAALSRKDSEVAQRARRLLDAITPRDRYRYRLERADRKSGPARYKLAEYCMRIGLHEEAIGEFETAARLEEACRAKWDRSKAKIAETLVALARRLSDEGDPSRAADLCDLVVDKFAGLPGGAAARALLKEFNEAARRLYEEAWSLYWKAGDEVAGRKLFLECALRYPRAAFLHEATPSGRTRHDIIRQFFGAKPK